MIKKIKILSIVGTRPQFIKSAMFSKALNDFTKTYSNVFDVKEILVHTGQHYDNNMSEQFFKELNIKKEKYNLGVSGGSHGEQTGRMMIELEKVVLKERPDIIVVFGDTNSTLAGALVGAKLNIPVAHIESGFRSFDYTMPEELNRVITDTISTYLFCFTESSVGLLNRENIVTNVHFVGDITYDALLEQVKSPDWTYGKTMQILKKLNIPFQEPYIYCSIHRANNTDDKENLINIFESLVKSKKKIIISLHPRTRLRMQEFKIWNKYSKCRNLHFIDPVGYVDNLHLINSASKVITDSGGVIKEAFFLNTACIVLRDNIEFFEAVKLKGAVLVGNRTKDILKEIKLFDGPRNKGIIHDGKTNYFFGNGKSAYNIVDVLMQPYLEKFVFKNKNKNIIKKTKINR